MLQVKSKKLICTPARNQIHLRRAYQIEKLFGSFESLSISSLLNLMREGILSIRQIKLQGDKKTKADRERGGGER